MKQKYFYYIGVKTPKGMRFVTSFDYKTKSAFWNANEKPLTLSKQTALDIIYGLNMNFILAVLITSYFELDDHYFELVEKDEVQKDE